jgi:hypothetical protein
MLEQEERKKKFLSLTWQFNSVAEANRKVAIFKTESILFENLKSNKIGEHFANEFLSEFSCRLYAFIGM